MADLGKLTICAFVRTPLNKPFRCRYNLAISSRTILCGLPELDHDGKDPSKVLRHLSMMDAIIVSTASPEIKRVVDEHFTQAWTTALRMFFPDPEQFMRLMDSTGSIASGSFVLWFLLGGPSDWKADNFDLYCPEYKSGEISRSLATFQGYSQNPPQDEIGGNQSDSAREFTHPSIYSVNHLINASGLRLDIIESSSPSALHPVAFSWTTLLTNYISARTLCIPYPFHVLARVGCLTHASNVQEVFVHAKEKYIKRGFRFIEFKTGATNEVVRAYPSVRNSCVDNPYCPNNVRTFGDKWCLQYTFQMELGLLMESVGCLIPEWRYGSMCGSCGESSDRQVNLIAH